MRIKQKKENLDPKQKSIFLYAKMKSMQKKNYISLSTQNIIIVTVALSFAFLAVACVSDFQAAPKVTKEDYARAERFLGWNVSRYILNGEVTYEWIGESDRFWYLRQKDNGKEFVIVDAATAQRQPAFDHEKLAQALAQAMGEDVDPKDLPFERFVFVDNERAIEVQVDTIRWHCVLGGMCREAEIRHIRGGDLVSPDGKWAAFNKGNDIWIRSMEDGTEKALTRDGEPYYGYGVATGSSQWKVRLFGSDEPVAPIAIWSPDSKKLLTEKVDERDVLDLHYLQHVPEDGSVRPQLYSVRSAMPDDAHRPSVEVVVFDITRGKRTDIPLRGQSLIGSDRVWWDTDGGQVFILPQEKGEKTLRLLTIDSVTGAVKLLIEESGKTYVEAGALYWEKPDIRFLSSGEIIWYSERSNWGHLYLYDRKGKLSNQITSGNWKVREIVRVDEKKRRIYFTAGGRERGEDPYQLHLYVVNLDGSGLSLLTPENADHEIRPNSFSPSGEYFVETYSRPDLPPVTLLRTHEGKVISTLEKADISALTAGGFHMPEPFSVLAADGKTKIYGNIFRPSTFDPKRIYPVIDVIYPGPASIVTNKTFMGALYGWVRPQCLAEIGFIVITIDGRGSPLRSKSFHDVSYNPLLYSGTPEDHIAGIRQLAKRYPYMDIDRVGIHGRSAGGYSSARAILAYPDFYKVAVSTNGIQDQRGAAPAGWHPASDGRYPGDDWNEQANARLAGNLKGKLLLAVGELDANVHPAHTMQLIDALIKANKDFDLLLLPNRTHFLDDESPYYIRKRWDYFVRHLMGAEPPSGYEVQGPDKVK